MTKPLTSVIVILAEGGIHGPVLPKEGEALDALMFRALCGSGIEATQAIVTSYNNQPLYGIGYIGTPRPWGNPKNMCIITPPDFKP